MFGVTVQIKNDFKRVEKEADKGNFRSLSHAAARIRKDMAASIERDPEPSDPGEPPHTRRGQLKRAFRYDVDKQLQEAVIGPLHSRVGESASAHELGGEFKGEIFEKRPFAFPALEKNIPRLAEEWRGSIGG